MSISLMKVNEPRLDIQPNRVYLTHMGATNVTTKPFNADSVSDSQIAWAITTPSVRVGLDKRIDVDLQFDVGCDGVDCVDARTNKVTTGIRQYPIHASTETINARLNDQSFTFEPNEVIHPLLSYGNDIEDRQHFMSATAHKPDIYWKYDQDGTNAGDRNPLGTFFNSGDEDSRNLQFFIQEFRPADGNGRFSNRYFRVRVIESLMMSPFYWGKNSHQALFGIQNFDLTLVFANLLRMVCGTSSGWFDAQTGIFPGGSLTNFKVRLAPDQTLQKLHITFLTPQPDVEVPAILHYPYYAIKTHRTDITTSVAGGVSVGNVNFNNITLHEIPKRCYIYVAPKKYSNSSTMVHLPDFFTRINSINMNFDNQDGRFSSLDSYDLCKLSQKNGLKRSWLEWNKTIGSVLCLEFGTDITLAPLSAPGVRGSYQLSFSLNFSDLRDQGEAPIEYRMYLVLVPEGVLTVDNSLVSISVGSLTEQDIASAPIAPTGTRLGVSSFVGSGFMDVIKKGWNWAKKILPFAGPASRLIGTVASAIPHPIAQSVGKVASLGATALGSGRRRGGRKSGGRLLRSSSLASRI